MTKPLDRRVRRTRRRLHDALIELIRDQGYDQITIQEITDRADLSRATFYLHYKTKDELLASSLEAMFDELVESVKDIMLRRQIELEDGEAPSLPAFEHVAEYADLYRSLLGEAGVSSVINRILNYIARIGEQQYRLFISEEDEKNLPVPIPVAARHMAGALFSMVSWWIDNDMEYTPEQMANYFHRMTVPATLSAFGRTSED